MLQCPCPLVTPSCPKFEYRVHLRAAGNSALISTCSAPLDEAPARMCNLDDLAAELFGHGIGFEWMAVAVAEEPHKPAGAPLAQIALLDHGGDGRAPGLWG